MELTASLLRRATRSAMDSSGSACAHLLQTLAAMDRSMHQRTCIALGSALASQFPWVLAV